MGNYSSYIGPGGQPFLGNLGAPRAEGYYEDDWLCKEVCHSRFHVTLDSVGGPFDISRDLTVYGEMTKRRICYRGDPDLDLPDERPKDCFEDPTIYMTDHPGSVWTVDVRVTSDLEYTKYIPMATFDCSSCHEKMEGCRHQKIKIERCKTERLQIQRGIREGTTRVNGGTPMDCVFKGCPSSPERECNIDNDGFGEYQDAWDFLGDRRYSNEFGHTTPEGQRNFVADLKDPNSPVREMVCSLVASLRCCCDDDYPGFDGVPCPETYKPCCNCGTSPVVGTP
jgi:hypothetical protein